MEKQISDTELVNSNVSSRTGSSTECLKAPTYVPERSAKFESILGLWWMKQVW